jgi:hypothetical protein
MIDPASSLNGQRSVWGDVKGFGGYVLIPPSVHPSGTAYASMNDGAPIVRVATLADVLPNPPAVGRAPMPPLTNVFSAASLYPLTLVERIKANLRIEDLIVPVKGSGRWAVALCPFHDDHAPSMRLDRRFNLAYCFTCSDKAMDVLTFYGRLHGLSNREAVKELALRYGA